MHDRLLVPPLWFDRYWRNCPPGMTIKCQLSEPVLLFCRRNIAERHENRVGRMVVASVERLQTLVSQFRNVARVTATVVVISGNGIEHFLDRLVQHGMRRTAVTFHLIVDNTLVDQRRIRVIRHFKLNPVAFLGKIKAVESREEHSIEVNLHKIEVILAALAGKGVSRIVAGREGIHKGVERTPDHEEKGIPDREFFTAAECGVFEDMRDAGRIFRYRTQGQHEDVFDIVGTQVIMLGARLVIVLLNRQVERGYRSLPDQ